MSSVPGWAGGGRGGGASTQNKITKTKGNIVKPILKKLSNSEKNSLDLDRDWESQEHNWSGSGVGSGMAWSGGAYDSSGMGAASRSARDVSFVSSRLADAGGIGASIGGGSSAAAIRVDPKASSSSIGGLGGTVRPKFSHGRSPSGASHISVATTGSSGVPGTSSRPGTFVHPFQQTPRTSTPPISYANSLASFDNNPNTPSGGRDYSPTITENEDDDDHIFRNDGEGGSYSLYRPHHSHSHSGGSGSHHPYTSNGHTLYSISQSSLRRPSLASQRTGSFSELNSSSMPATGPATQAILSGGASVAVGGPGGRFINSSRSTPANSTRLYHGGSLLSSSKSHSDLHLNLKLSTNDSSNISKPFGRGGGSSANVTPTGITMPASFASPSSSFSAAPMSPLRSSLDTVPRLRSLSEQQDRSSSFTTSSGGRGIVGAGSSLTSSSSAAGPPLNPAEHAKMVREARAKFEEKERARDEKLEKKRDRAASREAERQQKIAMKEYARSLRSGTGGASNSLDLPRPSTSASGSHDWLRRYGSSGLSGAPLVMSEKTPVAATTGAGAGNAFSSRSYDAASHGAEPTLTSTPAKGGGRRGGGGTGVGGGAGNTSAKKRTHGYWTSVILWIRTKIFKLSRGD